MMRPALPGGVRAAAPSAAAASGARHGSFAAPLPHPSPDPAHGQGVMWSACRMSHGQAYAQAQGQLHGHPQGQLAAPPPRAKSADAPVACRAAAPVAYAQAGVGAGVRFFRAPVPVHPQAEQLPRQLLPATHPAPPKPPPAAVVGGARLQGVARAGFSQTATSTADAPEALQKRLRPPEPASGSIAIGSAPAATRCRSG